MAKRVLRCGVLAASMVLLAGCSTTTAAGSSPAQPGSGTGTGQQSTPGTTMQPGMVMPDGTTMSPGMVMPDGTTMAGTDNSTGSPSSIAGGASGAAKDGPAPAGGPSASALMTCGQETKDNVAKILALPAAPHTADSWVNKLYTCTYQLADGPLVLSVKESADNQAARGYFDALRVVLGSTHSIDGLANLGLPAYQDAAGSVVFVKDNMTLRVDAGKLPDKVGPHGVSRNELAYEIATAVLACWSGK